MLTAKNIYIHLLCMHLQYLFKGDVDNIYTSRPMGLALILASLVQLTTYHEG